MASRLARRAVLEQIAVVLAAFPVSVALAPVVAEAREQAPTGDQLSVEFHNGWSNGYEIGVGVGKAVQEQTKTEASIVAGAVFDIVSRLTTYDGTLTLGRAHVVDDLMKVLTEWLNDRGLGEVHADVLHWEERLYGR